MPILFVQVTVPRFQSALAREVLSDYGIVDSSEHSIRIPIPLKVEHLGVTIINTPTREAAQLSFFVDAAHVSEGNVATSLADILTAALKPPHKIFVDCQEIAATSVAHRPTPNTIDVLRFPGMPATP